MPQLRPAALRRVIQDIRPSTLRFHVANDIGDIPTRPGLAYEFNKEGYRTLTQASMTVDKIAAATAIVSGLGGCAAYCSAAGVAVANAESGAGNLAIRAIVYLESKGIPATAAAGMALKAMTKVGTVANLKAKIQFGRDLVQKLNEMVREYHQSQGAQ